MNTWREISICNKNGITDDEGPWRERSEDHLEFWRKIVGAKAYDGWNMLVDPQGRYFWLWNEANLWLMQRDPDENNP